LRVVPGVTKSGSKFSNALIGFQIGISFNKTKHLKISPKIAIGEREKNKVFKTIVLEDCNHNGGEGIKIKVLNDKKSS
jgi:hypothetical protein